MIILKNIFLFGLGLLLLECSSDSGNCHPRQKMPKKGRSKKALDIITSTDSMCYGTYKGVEFNTDLEKNDIAHQFSNTMSRAVGDQLKKLYKKGSYSKVDFDHIKMITKGMNDGDNYVEYTLEIPFIRVAIKDEAMTAFDHSGGWNHYPAIKERKKILLNKERTTTVDGKLEISDLKTTKEGLQEFWIQWKHKDFQNSDL